MNKRTTKEIILMMVGLLTLILITVSGLFYLMDFGPSWAKAVLAAVITFFFIGTIFKRQL